MKRKASERNPKPPWQVHSSLHRPRRSSDSRSTPPKSTETPKSANLGDDNRRPQRSESAENAKTSEYAFFKKLKEDAIHDHRSCSQQKEACKTTNPKPREISRGRSNIVQNKSHGVRSSVLDKDSTYDRLRSSHPLPGSASRTTGLNRTRACAILEDSHRKQHCVVEECKSTVKRNGKGIDSEETETQYRHTDVFDRKRQKLLHWVRETSFPEIDDLCSNGYNIVSVLLSRLIPESNGNKNSTNLKLMQVVTDDKSMPLPSFESDIHFKDLQWTLRTNSMELGCDRYLGDAISRCSTTSREMVSCSYPPTGEAYKNHLQYTVWEPDTDFLGQSATSHANSDSNSILSFKDYELVTSSHVEDFDIFNQPNKYLVGRESCTPMLGWDFDMTDEERRLSKFSRYRTDFERLGGSEIACTMRDSDFFLPVKDFRMRSLNHFKELDVFCQTNDSMVGQNLCAPMLGWDDNSISDERNLSSLSRYRADSELLGGHAISCTMTDVNSVLPVEEYGFMASSHVEDLDGLCQPNQREPCTLMPGWDFDCTNEERNLTNLPRYRDKHSSAFLGSDHSHVGVDRQCLGGKYDLQSEFRHIKIPLALSPIPTFLNQAERCINDRAWTGATAFLSLQNDHWFTGKINNEGHPYPNAESLLQVSDSFTEQYYHAINFPGEGCSSSHLLTYDDKKDGCLDGSSHKRTFTHCTEDNVNIHESSALCLQMSMDREKAWPLAIDIDKLNWDGSKRELSLNEWGGLVTL